MRFFIALSIPGGYIHCLEDVQKNLKEILPEVGLTPREKLHLTLDFLGEHPDEIQNDLTESLRKACLGIKPFSIAPAYIDAFPNIHHPHTFWVGVKGDIDHLVILRERIKDEIINLGIPVDDRRFVPHIKIGGIPSREITPGEEEKIQHIPFENLDTIYINSIRLYNSVPDGSFHRHNMLAEIKLVDF
jgi:RNA 2',3'-cyclic 3'-phosphodiesterase